MRAGYRADVDAVARTSMTSRQTERVTATYEVTEYDPPRRYGTRSVHPHAKVVELYELDPEGGGTRLRLERDFDYDGLAKVGLVIGSILRPSAGLGFRRFLRTDTRESLQALKRLIEDG